MSRSLAIFLMFSSLLASVGLLIVSIFADRVMSFRMKDRKGNYIDVNRPNSANWISKICLVVGFIGLIASLIGMFAYRNR